MPEADNPIGERRSRPRGRPRVEERLERVSTRLPVQHFDQIVRLANQHEMSVSRFVRHLIVLRLR